MGRLTIDTGVLDDDELIALADQALASLNARYYDDAAETGRERFGESASEVADEIKAVCDAWDIFADRFRAP